MEFTKTSWFQDQGTTVKQGTGNKQEDFDFYVVGGHPGISIVKKQV